MRSNGQRECRFDARPAGTLPAPRRAPQLCCRRTAFTTTPCYDAHRRACQHLDSPRSPASPARYTDQRPAAPLPPPLLALWRRCPALASPSALHAPQSRSQHPSQPPGSPGASPSSPEPMLAAVRPQAACPVSGRWPIVLLGTVQAGRSRQKAGPSPPPSPPHSLGPCRPFPGPPAPLGWPLLLPPARDRSMGPASRRHTCGGPARRRRRPSRCAWGVLLWCSCSLGIDCYCTVIVSRNKNCVPAPCRRRSQPSQPARHTGSRQHSSTAPAAAGASSAASPHRAAMS